MKKKYDETSVLRTNFASHFRYIEVPLNGTCQPGSKKLCLVLSIRVKTKFIFARNGTLMVQACSRSKQLHNCIVFYTTLLGDNAHLKVRRPDSRFAMHAP